MDWLLESITTNYTYIITILVGLIIVERFARKLMSESRKTLANKIDVPQIKPIQHNMEVTTTDFDNQQTKGKN